MKLILCIKWGVTYSHEDVNILYGMVARNISGKFKVVCFTDDVSGIRSEVECLPLPPLGCDIPSDVPGKWPKVALWSKDLFGLQGVALFIDLDSIIVDNIDGYFEYGNPNDVITARNWLNRFRKSAQTSVFRFPIGGHSYMLEYLRADAAVVSRRYQYEQNYVTHKIQGGVKFWPECWTRHFRIHCMGSWPLRYLRPPILPAGAKIITFPGLPGPADAMLGRWTEHGQIRSPAEHLRWIWSQLRARKKWLRHISRFNQRAGWIEKYRLE